jgi:hypothetical protein
MTHTNNNDVTEKAKGTFDIKFSLINETNYATWAKLLQLMACHHQLAEEDNGSTLFKATNSAFFAIFLNLSAERQKDVIHLKSAQQVWDYFKNAYAGGSYIRLVTGVMDLVNFNPSSAADIRAGLSSLLQTVRRTECAAEKQSITFESLAVMTFLNKLPPQLSGSAGHLFRKKAATIAEIESELLGEEERLKARNPEAHQAMFAGSNQVNKEKEHSLGHL